MKNGSEYQSWLEKLEAPDIKGNFDQVHPAKLLFGFFQARKTGVLFVNDGVVKFYLYISQGCLVPYKKGIYEEREFHRYLRSRGVITDEEFYAFTKQSRQQGKNFVEYILERKLANRSDTEQMAEEFYGKNVKGLFSWRHGNYSFYSTILPHLKENADQLQMLRTIIDGVREKYHMGMIEQRLEKRMRSKLKLYTKAPLPLEDLLITREEQKIHEWIGEGATLSHIVTESELGMTDARALMFALLTINACKFAVKAKKKTKKAAKAEVVPDIAADRLTSLFNMAEKSVDRIHQQYKDQPFEPPAEPATDDIPVEIDPPAENDNPEDELRRRLQEHIKHLKEQRTDVSPEKTTASKTVMAAEETVDETADDDQDIPAVEMASAEEIGELDLGDPFGEAEGEQTDFLGDDGEFASMVDEEVAKKPIPEEESLGESEEDLTSPDEVDFLMDGDSDLQLGEIDDEGEQIIGEDEDRGIDEGFIDDGSPINFSDDDPPEHIYQLGVSLIEQEFWGKAHDVIRAALDRGLENPIGKIHLGLAYYYDRIDDPERFATASKYIQEGISASPSDPTGFLTLGKIYLEENDKAMAELYFIKALEIDRDCIEAKELIRTIYQDR